MRAAWGRIAGNAAAGLSDPQKMGNLRRVFHPRTAPHDAATGWIVAVFAPAVAVVAASSAVFRPVGGVSGSPARAPPDAPVAVTVGRAVGQSGCSSVGCHGGVGARVRPGG